MGFYSRRCEISLFFYYYFLKLFFFLSNFSSLIFYLLVHYPIVFSSRCLICTVTLFPFSFLVTISFPPWCFALQLLFITLLFPGTLINCVFVSAFDPSYCDAVFFCVLFFFHSLPSSSTSLLFHFIANSLIVSSCCSLHLDRLYIIASLFSCISGFSSRLYITWSSFSSFILFLSDLLCFWRYIALNFSVY